MYTFLVSVFLLFAGYFVYGKIIDRIFGSDSTRETPAITKADNVDFVPMSWWRVFLIQLLNIAGLGPIFGAVAGALWGPVVFLWIVFGCIFAGAVHDFLAGMLSIRNGGWSISEIVGKYLGSSAKIFMRVFSVVLMILVGAVFVAGPAKILTTMTSGFLQYKLWVGIVIAYYFLATILPVDKLIGRLYPIFAVSLLFMSVGTIFGLFYKGVELPELAFKNLHPASLNIWPMMFITVACGAISGFHATQAPMMARCIKSERYGRRVFYGAMICEGLIALIWAAISMSFFGGTEGLQQQLKEFSAGGVVYNTSIALLGKFGGLLAMLGVVVCPITSGDTAFRSARLIIADSFSFSQKKLVSRLYIALPLFVVGYVLTNIDFAVIWRYFAWSNQTLAVVVLWAAAVYLKQENKFHWVATVPAVFMCVVSVSYILQSPEGFGLKPAIGTAFGISAAFVCLIMFLNSMSSKSLLDNTIGGKSQYQTIEKD